jgi:hypothetical protein
LSADDGAAWEMDAGDGETRSWDDAFEERGSSTV